MEMDKAELERWLEAEGYVRSWKRVTAISGFSENGAKKPQSFSLPQKLVHHNDDMKEVKIVKLLTPQSCGEPWEVTLTFTYDLPSDPPSVRKLRQVKLTTGWLAFARFHNLRIGDELVIATHALMAKDNFHVYVFPMSAGDKMKYLLPDPSPALAAPSPADAVPAVPAKHVCTQDEVGCAAKKEKASSISTIVGGEGEVHVQIPAPIGQHQDCERTLSSQMDSKIPLISGRPTVFTQMSDPRSLPQVDLGKSRAFWVTKDLLAWNAKSDSSQFYLHFSDSAILETTAKGVGGSDVAVKLEEDLNGFPSKVLSKFRHITGYRALRLPANADAKKLLECQLTLTATDEKGEATDATSIQIARVLDDLFAYDGPLGANFVKGGVKFDINLAPTAQMICILEEQNPEVEANDPEELDPDTVAVDIKELRDAYIYVADLAGPRSDWVNIHVETDNDGMLVIGGKRKSREEIEPEIKFLQMERNHGRTFTRKMKLPENAHTDNISANWDDYGVFTITVGKIPSPKTAKPRVIQVTMGRHC